MDIEFTATEAGFDKGVGGALVMEKSHRTKLARKFRKYLGGKRVVVLGIPDEYDYMDPALVEILKRRCARFVSGT